MIGPLLALALATCDEALVAHLEEGRRGAACVLLSQPVEPSEHPTLDDIYARPGFEHARRRDAGALQTIFAQLLQKLRGFFETRGAESFSNVTRIAVLAIAFAIALAISLRRSRQKTARSTVPARAGLDTPMLDAPGVHLGRARELATTAPREALREALLALLSALEQARLARPDRVKTNRELVAELPQRGATPALSACVAELVEQFDRAYYSLQPVPAGLADDFVARVGPLVKELGS